MSAYKISDNIYAVGVQNPNLRVFDIIMKTEFGTTYNAYLVKGDNKTALIETVHDKFFDEYIENIKQICDVKSIDYIILNHCEPDHSGSLRRLLEINPSIQVISSVPGAKYLSKITNSTYNSHAVKDGDTVDLGGKILSFIVAPFLHWPDSMFTYCKNDKTLFSCDFLGAHYCELRILDTFINYPIDYESSFENYYQAIFGPFKKFVLSGLDKIDGLEIDRICPSHGPVLVDRINDAKEKYRNWSSICQKGNKALILYVSAYGYTEILAKIARDVLTENGYETEMLNVIENDMGSIKEKIDSANILMIGSPTINRDALKPIWDVISSIDAITNKDKPCGIFGSYGWSGEGVPMIVERIRSLKLNVYGDGYRANFLPNDTEIIEMREYTKGLINNI